MKVLGLVNQKGGVAKTTTASALAFGLARQGKKVLMIDFDPQGNLTNSTGIELVEKQPTSYNWLCCTGSYSATFEEVVKHVDEGVDLIPTNIALAEAEIILSSKLGREQFLKKAIASLPKKYDYVIVDSSPFLGLLTVNVLTACDEVIIPFKPEFFSVDGVTALLKVIYDIKNISNPKLKINGFLVTMKDSRRASTKDAIECINAIAEAQGTKVYISEIRASVVASDAPANAKSLFDYKPNSPVTKDYEEFVAEFLGGEK